MTRSHSLQPSASNQSGAVAGVLSNAEFGGETECAKNI